MLMKLGVPHSIFGIQYDEMSWDLGRFGEERAAWIDVQKKDSRP